MNIIELIADALQCPDGAYDRMIAMGVQPDVIDAILALNWGDNSAELSDCDGCDEWQKYTFLVRLP